MSVVVPTYNRLKRLRHVLSALSAQRAPTAEIEIVVVSDGATDGTDDYLRTKPFPNVVFVAQPNGGPAVARNHGVKVAQGELIVFIDDDVIAAPKLIEHHVASHRASEQHSVVIGPMLTPTDFTMTPWIRWEQAMLYKQYDALARGDYAPTCRQFYTGNASLPRATLIAVGGFDPRLRRAEDVELAYRLDAAGIQFSFNPEAIGYHYAERPFSSWLRNASEYGKNDVAFARAGRAWLLAKLIDEFRERHRLARWTTRACLACPPLEGIAQPVLKRLVSASDRIENEALTRAALSGLYHISYYRGMVDELGGAAIFRDLVAGRVRAADVAA